MIPDIAYLILNYNPDGEQGAQEILGKTIDSFYSRKSKTITCDVCVLDQGSTVRRREWLSEKKAAVRIFIDIFKPKCWYKRSYKLFC